MKKSKKMIIGLVLLAIGVIGILGLLGEFSSDVLLGSLISIVIGAVLIWLDKKPKKTTVSTTSAPQTSTPTPSEPKKEEIPDGEKDYNLFHELLDGQFLCYEYENKICLTDDAFEHIVGNGGKQITFDFEPENEYDKKAVALYVEGEKIGYVYQGKTQDMIHSYHKQGRTICGYLNKYSVTENTATFKIGFYKPMDYFESKQFSLVKTTKKIDDFSNRADNLSACDEGDLLIIEKEFLDDNYIVTTDTCDEIGELPKSAINFIEENCPRKIYGILDSCEEDENGKLKAKITVYLI